MVLFERYNLDHELSNYPILQEFLQSSHSSNSHRDEFWIQTKLPLIQILWQSPNSHCRVDNCPILGPSIQFRNNFHTKSCCIIDVDSASAQYLAWVIFHIFGRVIFSWNLPNHCLKKSFVKVTFKSPLLSELAILIFFIRRRPRISWGSFLVYQGLRAQHLLSTWVEFSTHSLSWPGRAGVVSCRPDLNLIGSCKILIQWEIRARPIETSAPATYCK